MCNDILDGHEEIDFIEAQSAEEVDDVEESVEEEQEVLRVWPKDCLT